MFVANIFTCQIFNNFRYNAGLKMTNSENLHKNNGQAEQKKNIISLADVETGFGKYIEVYFTFFI